MEPCETESASASLTTAAAQFDGSRGVALDLRQWLAGSGLTGPDLTSACRWAQLVMAEIIGAHDFLNREQDIVEFVRRFSLLPCFHPHYSVPVESLSWFESALGISKGNLSPLLKGLKRRLVIEETHGTHYGFRFPVAHWKGKPLSPKGGVPRFGLAIRVNYVDVVRQLSLLDPPQELQAALREVFVEQWIKPAEISAGLTSQPGRSRAREGATCAQGPGLDGHSARPSPSCQGLGPDFKPWPPPGSEQTRDGAIQVGPRSCAYEPGPGDPDPVPESGTGDTPVPNSGTPQDLQPWQTCVQNKVARAARLEDRPVPDSGTSAVGRVRPGEPIRSVPTLHDRLLALGYTPWPESSPGTRLDPARQQLKDIMVSLGIFGRKMPDGRHESGNFWLPAVREDPEFLLARLLEAAPRLLPTSHEPIRDLGRWLNGEWQRRRK